MTDPSLPELLVACLCADWCGTCRDYRDTFETIAGERPQAGFHWVDIEDEADWIGDIEVEDFPTILIQRGDTVLFFGPILPQPGHLRRTLDSLTALTDEEARAYAHGSDERRAWQRDCDLRAALARRMASDAG